MKPITYYRLPRFDVWHWMADCQHFPTVANAANVITTTLYDGQRPNYGELCNRCKAVEKKSK